MSYFEFQAHSVVVRVQKHSRYVHLAAASHSLAKFTSSSDFGIGFFFFFTCPVYVLSFENQGSFSLSFWIMFMSFVSSSSCLVAMGGKAPAPVSSVVLPQAGCRTEDAPTLSLLRRVRREAVLWCLLKCGTTRMFNQKLTLYSGERLTCPRRAVLFKPCWPPCESGCARPFLRRVWVCLLASELSWEGLLLFLFSEIFM